LNADVEAPTFGLLRDAHLALGGWQGCWSGVPDAP
jgi:hypothetical protein